MASFSHTRLDETESMEEPASLDEQRPEDEISEHQSNLREDSQSEVVIHDARDAITKEAGDDEGYGIGSWRPHCLQFLVCPVAFVALLCFFTFCDAFFSGIQVALLTTLETRYGLSSYQIGMVVTINKIGTMLGLPVAAYLGGRPNTHRPRWIAGSAFVMAAGMIMTCIPQFIFGPYQYRQSRSEDVSGGSHANFDLCGSSAKNQSLLFDPECAQNFSSENRAAYVIILVCQFIAGVGYAPIRPLGVSYIDDNVKPNRAGFYLGIISSMYGLAVVFGFLASSATSLVWVDFYRTETTLTQTDQAWVSAWWLLFIFIAFLLLLSGLPFLGFPKRLPRKWREDEDARGDNDGGESVGDDVEPDDSRFQGEFVRSFQLGGVREVFGSLKRIFMNGSYVLASFAFVASGLVTGLLSFFPKYIESQYGLPTSLVNILVALVIPALALGSILGGYLCRRWKLQIMGQTRLCLSCTCLASAFLVLLFPFGCANPQIVGLNLSSTESSADFDNMTSLCNKDCNCGDEVYQPVCLEAYHITYLSPCLAGCMSETQSNHTIGAQEFTNCTCLPDDNTSSDSNTGDPFTLSNGPCAYQCRTLVPFLICTFMFVFLFSAQGAPLVLTVVRSVESRDKSFAYGITKCLQYVIGVIPTPIITGTLVDTTCKLWQTECGARGACWIHDLPGFRYIMAGEGTLVLVIQGLLLLLCLVFLRRRLRYQHMAAVDGESDGQLPKERNVELELRDP